MTDPDPVYCRARGVPMKLAWKLSRRALFGIMRDMLGYAESL